MSRPRIMRRVTALAAVLLVAACSDDEPTGPGEDPTVRTLVVDASEDWAYVRLGETAQVVSVDDPTQSDAWDIAFLATSVMLNGGDAGPGGVVGHCLCANSATSDAEVMAMTPESELAGFLDVGVADVPVEEEAWSADALVPVISGWYVYDPVSHVVVAEPDSVWLIRTAEGEAYAKFRVVGLEGATRQHAGRVTIEYAVQSGAGSTMEEARQATLDLSAGPVYFDLVEGEEGDAADWDLKFEGYTIRVNGGASGGGQAGAVSAGEAFEAIEDVNDVPADLYRGDAFGGVFDQHRWYRYNLAGHHQIWPTYDVYLIRRGGEVYKVQLIGYYGPTGESRRITLRYAPIEE